MSWRAVAFLWLVAVGAVLLALGLRDSRGRADTNAAPLVPPLLIGNATVLRIRDRDGAMALSHRDGVWAQDEPFAWNVDSLAVRDALGTLERLAIIRVADSDSSEPPAGDTRLELIDAQGIGVECALGDRAPAGRAWFRIRTIGPSGAGSWRRVTSRDSLHESFERLPPRFWRDPTLLDGLGAECHAIELRASALPAPIGLKRTGATWMLTSPVRTRASREGVESWMESLARLRADAVIADTSAWESFGLSEPMAELTVGDAGGRERTLRVGSRLPQAQGEGGRYAAVEGIPMVVALDAVALKRLEPSLLSLVDARASSCRAPDVFTLEWWPLGATSPTWRISRDGFGWTPATEGGVATRALAACCEDRASDMSFQPMPAATQRGHLKLFGIDGDLLADLLIGQEISDPSGAADAARWAVESEPGVLRIFPSSWGRGLGLDPAVAVEAGNSAPAVTGVDAGATE